MNEKKTIDKYVFTPGLISILEMYCQPIICKSNKTLHPTLVYNKYLVIGGPIW